MSKEFFIGNKRYIIKNDNNDIRIYLADKFGNPSIELALTPFSDIMSKQYLTYDIDLSFKKLLNNFNKKYPIDKVSIPEKIITTKDHHLYLFYRKDNIYSIYNIKAKDIEEDNNYNRLLHQLLNGKSINVGNYILSTDTFYKLLNKDIDINNINDDYTKEIINDLIILYENLFGKINTSQDNGTGNVNSKVKVRKAGFASKLFIICLSFFSIGVIVALIIVIINKFMS